MKNRNTSPCWAAFASILLLAAIACQSPNSPSSISKTGTSSLSVSIANPSGRTVAAGSADIGIATLAISVTGGASSVAPVTGINYGTFTAQTFSLLTAGTYTVSVNAYNTSSVLVASGSSSVTVNAGSTTSATVALTLGQTGGSGAFSLAIAWPTSTGLNSVSAAVDGIPLIYTPTVTTSGANYTSTLAQGVLTSGVHTLAITFKTSVGAAVGPFLESLNIWDGVTSTTWVDSSGNNQSQRTFSAAEFASNNTDLAGLSFNNVGLSTDFSSSVFSYTFSGGSGFNNGNTFTVTVSPTLQSQNVVLRWNGVIQNWASITSASMSSSGLSSTTGVNTLEIIVTAPDRATTQTYTMTTPFLSSAASLASDISANLSGSFVLTQDATISSPLGSTSNPFQGTIEGNGHVVTLAVTGSATYAGMFADIGNNGKVQNLNLSGSLSGNQVVGALAGINEGTVTNCASNATVTGNQQVGGVVGYNSGTMNSCSSNGTVSGTGSNQYYVGGVVGYTVGSLNMCYFWGTVTSGDYAVGGLAGYVGSPAVVDQSYAHATVTANTTASAIGGLVGVFATGATLKDSYALVDVSGYTEVGGLVGDNNGTIQSCYAGGVVTSAITPFGGLVGITTPAIPDSYDSTPGDTYYLAALKTQVPAGWNASTWGWVQRINSPYPYLQFYQIHGVYIH